MGASAQADARRSLVGAVVSSVRWILGLHLVAIPNMTTRGALTFEMLAPEPARTPRAKSEQQILHERAIDDLFSQITARQLPEPVRFHLFSDDPKRKWRLDLAFVNYMIALELESRKKAKDLRTECLKHGSATLEGWWVVRFESSLIEDGTAVDLLTKMLRVKGWRPGDLQPAPVASEPRPHRRRRWRY